MGVDLSEAQILNKDLSKYSYYLYLEVDANSIEEGTGFLVRKNNQLYLVTASHAISGHYYDSLGMHIKPNYPDILNLRVTRKQDGVMDFFPINIFEAKKKINLLHYSKTPDICFIKIDLPEKYQINTIESLIVEYPTSQIVPDNCIMFGFPNGSSSIPKLEYLRRNASLATGKVQNYSYALKWNANPYIDINQYWDDFNYIAFLTGVFGAGNSGTPIFFTSSQKVIFGGMCVAGNYEAKQLFALRPEVIKQLYNNL